MPLFTQPMLDAKELDRLRGETLQRLRSNLRLEQIELVGLVALDNVIYEGTSYAHPDMGTEKGLEAVTYAYPYGCLVRVMFDALLVPSIETLTELTDYRRMGT